MGETANQPFQLSFNAALKVEFQGPRVTSDDGLILVCELDERAVLFGLWVLSLLYMTESGCYSASAWR